MSLGHFIGGFNGLGQDRIGLFDGPLMDGVLVQVGKNFAGAFQGQDVVVSA